MGVQERRWISRKLKNPILKGGKALISREGGEYEIHLGILEGRKERGAEMRLIVRERIGGQ